MIASLPVGPARRSELGGKMALASESTALLARRCDSTELTMFHCCLADPVDARITTNRLVVGVDHDHLKELVGPVLSHPVRVQNSQLRHLLADSVLSHSSQRLLVLELVDTLVLWLPIDLT